jgi:hypothetical protein
MTFLLVFSLRGFAEEPSCENPTRTVSISKNTLKKWNNDVMPFMTDARIDCPDSTDSCLLTHLVADPNNPFSVLGLQDGDRLLGTETQDLKKSGDFIVAVLPSILKQNAKCMRIERAGLREVIRYSARN